MSYKEFKLASLRFCLWTETTGLKLGVSPVTRTPKVYALNVLSSIQATTKATLWCRRTLLWIDPGVCTAQHHFGSSLRHSASVPLPVYTHTVYPSHQPHFDALGQHHQTCSSLATIMTLRSSAAASPCSCSRLDVKLVVIPPSQLEYVRFFDATPPRMERLPSSK